MMLASTGHSVVGWNGYQCVQTLRSLSGTRSQFSCVCRIFSFSLCSVFSKKEIWDPLAQVWSNIHRCSGFFPRACRSMSTCGSGFGLVAIRSVARLQSVQFKLHGEASATTSAKLLCALRLRPVQLWRRFLQRRGWIALFHLLRL
jgi:hypothetical protein